jgi:dimeric dUTPase (all-alpha-NTP-PPase superfamily)
MGGDPQSMDDETAIQFFKDMVLALTDELHEAMNEIGWKPWATSKHFNTEAVKGELVDCLHFFINLCLVAGLEPDSLHSRYVTKNKKNALRQMEGYDGLNKCPGCKRALDDAATECIPYVETADGQPIKRTVWCMEKRLLVDMDAPSRDDDAASANDEGR